MEAASKKKEQVEALRKIILEAEGYSEKNLVNKQIGPLGELEQAFPLQQFPEGVIHEFISDRAEQTAASTGFISCLLTQLIKPARPCIWVSLGNKLFPSALLQYGIDPEQIIFIQAPEAQQALWSLEESLKCSSLAAVVGEIQDLDLNACRRLQLAVERSQVTCFLHRYRPRRLYNLAFASRWRIQPMPSQNEPGLPGIGHPFWDVHLERVRNGQSGRWKIGWKNQKINYIRNKKDIELWKQTGS